jgi:hypothetical protein
MWTGIRRSVLATKLLPILFPDSFLAATKDAFVVQAVAECILPFFI